jgi:hypothetical protein
MIVMLENPRTGDRKPVKVGWSWTYFLFSWMLGLPLFRNGLVLWGALVVVCWSVDFGLPYILPPTAEPGLLILAPPVAIACLAVFVGLQGNAMVARRYLAQGYVFAKPDTAEARHAQQQWGVPG